MTLDDKETQALIELVLNLTPQTARKRLHENLLQIKRTEPEFYAGVIEHGPKMPLTSDQWFDFFSKIPADLFYDQTLLNSKLSPSQREQLGLE